MKPFQNVGVRREADLALDMVSRSDVHSAYNKRGELSHLVVTVPRGEFFQLYPAGSDANVFMEGHWLQFSFGPETSRLVSRRTGATIFIDISDDSILQKTRVSFFHDGKKLFGCKVSSYTHRTLTTTSFGLQTLARMACRALVLLESRSIEERAFVAQLPCIHVIPEPLETKEFDSGLVNLQ